MFYFDTNFIVPYFLPEAASPQIENFLQKFDSGLAISHWTKTEFASAVGLKCRIGQISVPEAEAAHERFQDIIAAYFSVLAPQEQDFSLAATYLRQPDLGLRAGDALHLAIAKNNKVVHLYSFDKVMVSAAGRLNLPASLGI